VNNAENRIKSGPKVKKSWC